MACKYCKQPIVDPMTHQPIDPGVPRRDFIRYSLLHIRLHHRDKYNAVVAYLISIARKSTDVEYAIRTIDRPHDWEGVRHFFH